MSWTECLCPPKVLCRNPTLQGDSVRRRGTWEARDLRKFQGDLLPVSALSPVKTESAICSPEEGSPQNLARLHPDCAGALILDSQPQNCEQVDSEVCKPPVCATVLLSQPGQTKTTGQSYGKTHNEIPFHTRTDSTWTEDLNVNNTVSEENEKRSLPARL